MTTYHKAHVYLLDRNGELVLESPNDVSHPYSSTDVVTFLTRQLPRSLPILRRLQVGPRSDQTLLITTPLPLDNDPLKLTDDPSTASPGSVWTMAIVDRNGYPSTEIWPFSSLELYHGTAPHEQGPQNPDVAPSSLVLPFAEEVLNEATAQLLEVLSHVPVTNREPVGLLQNMSQKPASAGTAMCLAGNVHTTTAALLARVSVITNSSPPYGKYIFAVPRGGDQAPAAVSAPIGSSVGLPEGLIWSTIGPSDYVDVMAVNKVVRSTSTIAHLTSVAIRLAALKPDGAPGKAIAFVFASGDGSVRTLHVDPEYRRKGLAKALVLRLLGTGAFEAPRTGPLAADEEVRSLMEPEALVFTGIEGSNVGSIKTFQGVGGKWHWDTYWLWLDWNKIAKQVVEERMG